jgi:hypothetical protein
MSEMRRDGIHDYRSDGQTGAAAKTVAEGYLRQAFSAALAGIRKRYRQ